VSTNTTKPGKPYGPLLPEYRPELSDYQAPIVTSEELAISRQARVPYHLPPDDYRPPSTCLECERYVFFGPVMGGYIWMHLLGWSELAPPHTAVVGVWWDTTTGEWRVGAGLEEVLERAREIPPILGRTPG